MAESISINGLPKHLSLLLETLVLNNGITSWNIYQNRINNTCVTIRFNDSSPNMSSLKYRKISDRQMYRNIDRAKKFQSVQTECHVDKICEMDSATPTKKRKKDNISPECSRTDMELSPICVGLTIDSPDSVMGGKHVTPTRTPDAIHTLLSPTDTNPSILHYAQLSEKRINVEYEHTSITLPPVTYVIDSVDLVEAVDYCEPSLCPDIITYEDTEECTYDNSAHLTLLSETVIHTSPVLPSPLPRKNKQSTHNNGRNVTFQCPCCDIPMSPTHECSPSSSHSPPPSPIPLGPPDDNDNIDESVPQVISDPSELPRPPDTPSAITPGLARLTAHLENPENRAMIMQECKMQ